MRQKLILVGKYHIIEPLGILYLAGLAKQLGWDCRVVLVDNFDFEPLLEEVRLFKPDLVGFSLWTGYHMQTFEACDRLQRMGVKVAIGGPHASYFTEECKKHATWVVKGEGFRNFRRLLQGQLPEGIHFDPERMAEGFPVPDRDVVYQSYPELGRSPIKSIFCSLGCPFRCSYCYAPSYNEMYGGFELNVRPVDEIVDEVLAILERWPLSMMYAQDDIFGFNIPWLREFAKAWRQRVGIPWHCQIRLELTRDIERLELFREADCTGITLAIESGNDFLRRFVLLRPMPDELIINGTRRIQDLGFTLRTEQILAVPFSDIETDLETLELNNRINPEMAWTSILAPYGGTNMGTIAKEFGFYEKNNDDLDETFFGRSVLRHSDRGREVIAPEVLRSQKGQKDNPLLRMTTRRRDNLTADVHFKDLFGRIPARELPVCQLQYLDAPANDRYCDQTVILQRIFNWLSKIPRGSELGSKYVSLPKNEWTWKRLGELTAEHLQHCGYGGKMAGWLGRLAESLGYPAQQLPRGIVDNPYYFCFFPAGDLFARQLLETGFFDIRDSAAQFDTLGRAARHWLFDRALYKLQDGASPIAQTTS